MPDGDTPLGHPPIIKITLQHMEHTLHHAMAEYLVQQDAAMQAAIKDAVAGYDYQAEVGRIVHKLLGEAIEVALRHHFREGRPSTLVREAVGAVITESMLELAKRHVGEDA